MIDKALDKLTLELVDEPASERFAERLSLCIKAPLVLAFQGDIGAGKTTIIRAMLKKLGVKEAIKSPTFSLVESYQYQNILIHHFDLYRIHHEDELEYLGFRDYFTNHTICCIEWAERAETVLPLIDIRFNLSSKGAGRDMQISAASSTGKKILACLAGEL